MQDWRTLSERTVYDAQPYLRVVRQRVLLPDGREIDDFYQVHLRDFAAVVPLTADGRVVTIRQYKHGPGRVSITFPSGFVDDGEAPEDAARRELLEESGYAAGALRSLGRFVDNGNQRGCVGHYYLATGCRPVQPPCSGDLEEMVTELTTPGVLDAALDADGFAIGHMAAAWAFARRHLPG